MRIFVKTECPFWKPQIFDPLYLWFLGCHYAVCGVMAPLIYKKARFFGITTYKNGTHFWEAGESGDRCLDLEPKCLPMTPLCYPFLAKSKFERISMEWLSLATKNIPLVLCGAFYALLCVFSVVTGIIYITGRRELNPLELPDRFVARLEGEGKLARFAKTMGFVTFVVGVVQGLTAYAILRAGSPARWWLALGFTLFSIGSVGFKLRGKIHPFPLLKLVAYLAILVILLLGSTRALFF